MIPLTFTLTIAEMFFSFFFILQKDFEIALKIFVSIYFSLANYTTTSRESWVSVCVCAHILWRMFWTNNENHQRPKKVHRRF